MTVLEPVKSQQMKEHKGAQDDLRGYSNNVAMYCVG